MTDDRGSGGLAVVWATALVVSATVAALTWSAALESRQRAGMAADLAALAAASAQLRGQDPCWTAERVARAQGARVLECVARPRSVAVVVEVVTPAAVLRRLELPPARARARAGSPP